MLVALNHCRKVCAEPYFTEGTTNIHALTFKDHVATNMHKGAMALEAKEAASSLMEFAPTAKAMAQANLSEASKVED